MEFLRVCHYHILSYYPPFIPVLSCHCHYHCYYHTYCHTDPHTVKLTVIMSHCHITTTDNQADCNQWAPGIEIIAVRVTKPRVPDKISASFVQIESEKTLLQISVEEQRVAEKRAETRRKEATITAQAELEVAQIQLQIQVASREAK
jgi:hypothetical protein